jgi:hypothetical protein
VIYLGLVNTRFRALEARRCQRGGGWRRLWEGKPAD